MLSSHCLLTLCYYHWCRTCLSSAATFICFVTRPCVDCIGGLFSSAATRIATARSTETLATATTTSAGVGRVLGGGAGPTASAAGAAAAARFAALSSASKEASNLTAVQVGAASLAASSQEEIYRSDSETTIAGSAAGPVSGPGGLLAVASDAVVQASGIVPHTRYTRLNDDDEKDISAV